MLDDHIHTYSNYLKILSNHMRLKIIIELSKCDLFFSDLMNKLQLKQSTLSTHISKLKEYGIIYTLNKGGFIELRLNKIILKNYLGDDFLKPFKTIKK